MKILNPVGFKLMAPGPLQRCVVARKGQPVLGPLAREHVWWCMHPTHRQLVAALPDPRTGGLKELPLPKCIELWGWDPLHEAADGGASPPLSEGGGGRRSDGPLSEEAADKLAKAGGEVVVVEGEAVTVPRVPPKYLRWLRARAGIYREIANMSDLGAHPNVVVRRVPTTTPWATDGATLAVFV
jgi:hypothetical protein